MIEYFKHKKELNRLINLRDKANTENWKEVEIAKKSKEPHLTIQELEHNAWSEDQYLTEEISILLTRHLTNKANKYFLPIPTHEESGMWQQCSHASNQFVLSKEGITKVRSMIRDEEKSKRDIILIYTAAITGLLGAATGLIAIIKQ